MAFGTVHSKYRKDYDYASALAFLNGKTERKICSNRWMIKKGKAVAIKLYSTNIITFEPNGDTILETGGFNTRMTWDSINAFQKHSAWFKNGERVVRGGDGIDYLFHHDSVYYYRGHSITIKADGTINSRPYYAEILQSLTGQKCETKDQMLAIIKGLDKATVEKFMKRITIDNVIGTLCLTVYTGKESLEESLASLTPEQLWMVWRRGDWETAEKIQPHLIKTLSKVSFDLAWKIWLRASNREEITKKLQPRLNKYLSGLPLEKIERMWNKTGYNGKELIAKCCTKDFLPLIINEKIKKNQWSTGINDIVISRLRTA